MSIRNEGPPDIKAAKALQALINSGEVFKFPGTFGRAAMEAIRDGRNLLPRPVPGKIGSPEYVARIMGEEYLNQLKEVS